MRPDRRRLATLLAWSERVLVTVGIVLAVWCAAVLLEARRVSHMPVPAPSHAHAAVSLPGDASAPSAARAPSTTTPAPLTGAWLGRLEAPSVDLAATVLEGSDDGTLARAAGHIEDTALPGQPGNVGIAGHRDTIFRPVRNLHVGDRLVLTTRDRMYYYRISSERIVGPDDVWVLDPTPQPALTLVTCYPFTFIGHAPKRFIVRADLIGQQSR